MLGRNDSFFFSLKKVLFQAAEAFMVQFFENALLCSQHAKRITVMQRDVQLVRRLFDI